EKGRGQANLGLTARLVPTANGTRVEVEQDLQLSGAAAQYGRGMISDVSAVMMRDFATNMQTRIDAFDRGVSPDQIQQAKSAGGFGIALAAAWMALKRVGRRFFLPYQPDRI
ncbi:MAG TPA: carbon monoxide dehydrogenase, partial [Acidimicrobiia bacterium]|nr:carbon monoxide dehydrogenase [Acidimicrobiia bacterium]